MSAEITKIILEGVFAILLALLSYGVKKLYPIAVVWLATGISKSQRDDLEYWVGVGVKWAKQWMEREDGQKKKAAVMDFVVQKIKELGLPYTEDDADKAIEAVYLTIKNSAKEASVADMEVEPDVVN